VLGLEQLVTIREVLPGCAWVRTKCAGKTCVGLWGYSWGPRELPGVGGPGLGEAGRYRFLICWNRNFMELLNIQKIFSVFPSRSRRILMISGFLRIDLVMLMILIILSSRASCCTSMLKIQGLPHA
jgi:hypothetical protein